MKFGSQLGTAELHDFIGMQLNFETQLPGFG
jgi:hypothetical protein